MNSPLQKKKKKLIFIFNIHALSQIGHSRIAHNLATLARVWKNSQGSWHGAKTLTNQPFLLKYRLIWFVKNHTNSPHNLTSTIIQGSCVSI